MPPSPVYNWLCVLHTTSEILANIARHKAAQFGPECIASKGQQARRPRRVEVSTVVEKKTTDAVAGVETNPEHTEIRQEISSQKVEKTCQTDFPQAPLPVEPNLGPVPEPEPEPELITASAAPLHTRTLQSSRVPSSRIGRLFHYGGLAASLGYGAATELLRRTGKGPNEAHGSLIMTEANIKRLVSKLSQMRGAALKLGQFLSIQDTHLLPPDVDAIFRRVQDSAHYMPDSQLKQTLSSELCPDWESKYFASFDHIPFAAASIGQVHSAYLLPSATSTYPFSTNDNSPIPVAVKVQFPNIRNSIESDLSYVRMLLTASNILPKGMFLDRTVEVMKSELADECSYTREASFLRMFGRDEFLGKDKRFKVPWVWEGSTEGVLVMERVEGVSVGEAQRLGLIKRDRNEIAERITELCLRELFEFRTMQTDPNWTNFLWNPRTRQIELVDFGATRTYTKSFMDNWFRLLQAAIQDDHEACREWSLKLGYLTGEENETMLKAHISSLSLLASPFKPLPYTSTSTRPSLYAFGPNSEWTRVITKRIREELIPVMLRERLTPPPRETYSLNRKLSGTFLLAARLDAEIDTRAIWERVVGEYRVDD